MRRLRIFAADDNPEDRALVLRALAKAHGPVKATEVIDPRTLEAALQARGYDLAVIDYKLNWTTGLDLLPHLKARFPRCPVIMFTATGNEEVAVEAMKRGLDDYVLKSPQPARLAGAAGAALKRAREAARAEAERRRLVKALREKEEELRQAQKLEAVGRLAGGVAHDFNNMLTAINGYGELLLEMAGENHPFSEQLAEILKAGGRAAVLTRQLLAFSRRQLLRPERVDLAALVRGLEPAIREAAGPQVKVHFLLGGEPAPIFADPAQLGYALLNLIANARDAMPEGGSLFVETALSASGREAEPFPPAAEGPEAPWADLLVRDTGTGMDREVRARLFEPFFTTKPMGKGSGLGLCTAYGIVKQSGGDISVDSRPGQGSRFRIRLPVDAPMDMGSRAPRPVIAETELFSYPSLAFPQASKVPNWPETA